MPNTTPAVPKSGAKPKRTEIDMKASKHKLCTCDLQLNFCDINCCCDEECSSNDKLVFHHCETEERHYDTRYCEYMKYIYINNTPFEWQVNQNGLFCIIKSNLPPSYTIQRKHPLKTFDAAKSEKQNKFTWPNYDSGGSGQISVFNESEKFLYGNHVWLVRRNGISKFQLPNKFITNRCIIDEDVFNMKNMENVCAQTDISEDNPYLNMKTFFEDMYVIAAPSLVNVSKYTHGIFQVNNIFCSL
ncbi:hypothetical protein JTB14_001695 [Gonioctena quinquepunctata]|nr:hypothetical protein JTB14_001695 [Gonioctena quinquepunctata]